MYHINKDIKYEFYIESAFCLSLCLSEKNRSKMMCVHFSTREFIILDPL